MRIPCAGSMRRRGAERVVVFLAEGKQKTAVAREALLEHQSSRTKISMAFEESGFALVAPAVCDQ